MKKLAFVPCANSVGFTQSPSDTVYNAALSGGIAKTFVKPAGARFVRLSAGSVFYFSAYGVAKVPSIDAFDGTGSVAVPASDLPFFTVDDVVQISVIASGTVNVSAEWFA